MKNRNEKLLANIPLQQTIGAEIGPLHNALISKEDRTVFYVDHCDTESLKARWSTDPSVDLSKLHVDAVCGGNSLRHAIDHSNLAEDNSLKGCLLDYIVASHVVESRHNYLVQRNSVGA